VKQPGDASRRNLAIVGCVLLLPGPWHFNRICRVAAEMFGLRNRGTISRCLQALMKRQMVKKVSDGKGKKTTFYPDQRKVANLVSKYQQLQEATKRRVPRIPGVKLKSLTRSALPVAWFNYLGALPEVRRWAVAHGAREPSGAYLDFALSAEEPRWYLRLRNLWNKEEKKA
jgi:hypothetical protein